MRRVGLELRYLCCLKKNRYLLLKLQYGCSDASLQFSQALISLGDKTEDEELKILCLDTLAHLVPLYPTLHRSLHAALSSSAIKFLNGATPQPTSSRLLSSASRLNALLHYTGGKVGAATQWRKAVDDAILFTWGSFMSIRTTFPAPGNPDVFAPQPVFNQDPIVNIPLNVDRLRAAVVVLCDLMHTSNPRAVVLPIGPLVRLCVALIRCTPDEKIEGHVDPVIHTMELSAIPHIQKLGCDLVRALAFCTHQHLTPHMSQLLFYLVHQLEKQYPSQERLPFLQATASLVHNCAPPHDPLLHSRVTRAVLPFINHLLATQAEVQRDTDTTTSGSKSKRGKKRAKGYEGDEVFSVNRSIICPTKSDGDVVLATLELLQLILRNGLLTPAVQSIATRVLLSIYVGLPQTPPVHISLDTSLHGRILEKVSRICAEFAAGTTSTMSKSLGLVLGTSLQSPTSSGVTRELELLLHPRAPPLVRSLPHIETLSLFQAEESQEEQEARHTLQIGVPGELAAATQEPDVAMDIQLISSSHIAPPTNHVVPVTVPTVPSGPSMSVVQAPPRAALQVIQPAVPAPAVTPSTASFQPPPTSASIPKANDSSLTRSSANTSTTASIAQATPPVSSSRMVVDDEDEDEPMPTIDVESDSELE
ncbi:unnamed protein product [Somion occarium]|uniref:Pre-rRNA-processing protein RIX1 n=1 Tax=Somion occarium TaxID=3059160 RepID=A0ABP1CZV1_9APHY